MLNKNIDELTSPARVSNPGRAQELFMGKKKHTEKLEPDKFYHVFNRGINGTRIFSSNQNYAYFLTLLQKHIIPVSKIHCYCLLPNHFHFLIEMKSENELKFNFPSLNTDIETFISKQFSNFFNAYSQAYNNSVGRTGRLFEQPFRRIHINSEEYLRRTVLYIHNNPKKHSIEENIENYPFSSYQFIVSKNKSFLNTDEVISWFEDLENFIYSHNNN